MEKKYFALLIEDNLICQRFQKALLEANGFQVDVTNTARQAIEKLNQMEEQLHHITYDVIFVDFVLPDLYGDHVVNIIRRTTKCGEAFNEKVIIVAVTAYATEKTKNKLYKSGVDHIIEKPILQSDLKHPIFKKAYKNKKEQVIEC